ncbi:DUF4440 domain-containing protein [Nesterenkonia alkaliphila]|uniref:DUF4440 domain-containing protein n=1 Tax=Nesterenkonia alkaliphila TaxID=1463631 RepID=A0A7K1UFP6_9MICC|nr:DUF4440 domain-containing protein [Nesterenkonia alkaliphila]
MSSHAGDENLTVAAAWDGELRLLDPRVRSEAGPMEELLAPDFHEIGQSGTHWSRDQILSVISAEDASEHAPVLSEQRGDVVAPGLVLLTYFLEFGERRSRRSSLWRIRPEGSVLVFLQGAPVA